MNVPQISLIVDSVLVKDSERVVETINLQSTVDVEFFFYGYNPLESLGVPRCNGSW